MSGALSRRYIGGESGHRSFFGGTVPKARIVGFAVGMLLFIILTPLLQLWGVAIGLAVVSVTLLVTQRTHRGSLLDRRKKKARWKYRVKTGIDAFRPFNVAEWDQLEEAAKNAKGRKAKWAARRALAEMRSNPDGSEGMGWLQQGEGIPGVAWHSPLGEEPYLSVVFSATGQLRGMESEAAVNAASEAWGQFLAARAAKTSLCRYVQTLTRVVPADSALHEYWALSNLDPDAPPEAMRSYADVLRITGQGAMVQRHYFIGRWMITSAFRDAAKRYGEGRDGWRKLMEAEISSFASALENAKQGSVEVLTARRTAAIIRHMQNPSRPIDYVKDVTATGFGVPSHDEFSAHIVEATDPDTDEPIEWWHRTAAIKAEGLDVGERTPLWLVPFLINGLNSIRSISFHERLIHARSAKRQARKDLTRDASDASAHADSGKLEDDETNMNMSAAQRRVFDLRSGSSHHGVEWIGFITITERDRDRLVIACRELTDLVAGELGIENLEWLDSYQASASGATWPIARGQEPAQSPLVERFADRLAGTGEKEAIS